VALLRATFQAFIDAGPTGDTLPVDVSWTSATGQGQIDVLALVANTDATLSVPTGTSLVVVIPPTTSSTPWVTKGAAGDTGQSRIPNMAVVLTAGGGNLILRATANVTFTVVYL